MKEERNLICYYDNKETRNYVGIFISNGEVKVELTISLKFHSSPNIYDMSIIKQIIDNETNKIYDVRYYDGYEIYLCTSNDDNVIEVKFAHEVEDVFVDSNLEYIRKI